MTQAPPVQTLPTPAPHPVPLPRKRGDTSVHTSNDKRARLGSELGHAQMYPDGRACQMCTKKETVIITVWVPGSSPCICRVTHSLLVIVRLCGGVIQPTRLYSWLSDSQPHTSPLSRCPSVWFMFALVQDSDSDESIPGLFMFWGAKPRKGKTQGQFCGYCHRVWEAKFKLRCHENDKPVIIRGRSPHSVLHRGLQWHHTTVFSIMVG
jgi:hypothetical protein